MGFLVRGRLWVASILLGLLASSILPINLWASVERAGAAAETQGKKMGYMGDPARKRGLELGYDEGYRAGKADKAAGKPANPKDHEAFTNPQKWFRHEYGSASAFISSFRSGFLGGYKKAMGVSKINADHLATPSAVSATSASKLKPNGSWPKESNDARISTHVTSPKTVKTAKPVDVSGDAL